MHRRALSYRICVGLHAAEVHLLVDGLVPNVGSKGGELVVSIATNPGLANSQLLNRIWNCRFEERRERRGLYHSGMIQLQLPLGPRTDAIIDVQGAFEVVPSAVRKALLQRGTLVLVHCCTRDLSFVDGRYRLGAELQTILDCSQQQSTNCPRFLVMVHGVAENDKSTVMENLSTSVSPDSISTQICFIAFKETTASDAETAGVHQFLFHRENHGTTPAIDAVKALCDSFAACASECDDVVTTAIPPVLCEFGNDVCATIRAERQDPKQWFPLHNLSAEIARKDDLVYENPEKMEQLNLEMKKLEASRSSCGEEANIVKFFRSSIMNTADLQVETFDIFLDRLGYIFAPIIGGLQRELTRIKDEIDHSCTMDSELVSTKESIEKRLISLDVSSVSFIRELIEIEQLQGTNSEAAMVARKLCHNQLSIGRSIELLNGDSGTVNFDFLSSIKWDDLPATTGRSDFVSITIVGAESSGKSTLWNELWHTNFPVAHGKCSRGLCSALVHLSEGPTLMINDTEGILSPLKNDPKFNQRLVLYAFCVSQIVILNIRGEGDRSLVEIMKLIIYAAQRLSLFHRPRLVFVNRDVTGRSDFEKKNLRSIVLHEFRKACAMLKVNLDEIIDLEGILTFDIPTPLIEPKVLIAGCSSKMERFRPEFATSCRELRTKLIAMAQAVVKKESQFPKSISGDSGWINRCGRMWRLVKQNADLYTFQSFTEKLQMTFIEEQVQQLQQEHLGISYRMKCVQVTNALLQDRCQSVEVPEEGTMVPTYTEFVSCFTALCRVKMEQGLKQKMSEFKGGTIPDGLVSRYINKIGSLAASAQQEQEWRYEHEFRTKSCEDQVAEAFRSVKDAFTDLLGKHTSRQEVEVIFNNKVQVAKDKFVKRICSDTALNVGRQIKNFYVQQCKPIVENEFARDYLSAEVVVGEVCPEAVAMFEDSQLQFTGAESNDVKATVSRILSRIDWSQPTERDEYSGSQRSRFSSFVNFCQRKISPHSYIHAQKEAVGSEISVVIERMYPAIWNVLHTANNWQSEDLNWQALCLSTASLIDKEFVARGIRSISKLRFEPGAQLTLINEMHSIGCRLMMSYYRLHLEHQNSVEAVRFEEYAVAQRDHLLLRADQADSLHALAQEIAKKIVKCATNHFNGESVQCLEAQMAGWFVNPEELFEKAMHQTFACRNIAAAWDYVEDPCRWIKMNLFDERFMDVLKTSTNSVFNDVLNLANPVSRVSRSLGKTLAEISELFTSCQNPTEVIASLEKLFEGELSYAGNIKESCVIFAKNTMASLEECSDVSQFSVYLQKCVNDCAKPMEVYKTITLSSFRITLMNLKSWEVSRGCGKLCPYCQQKCTGGPGHTKHSCTHHLLQAFGGWRHYGTANPVLSICSDPGNLMAEYSSMDAEDKMYPFEQHMAKFHPDWIILPAASDPVTEGEKACWVALRQRFAAKHKYKDTTPKEWTELYSASNLKSLQA